MIAIALLDVDDGARNMNDVYCNMLSCVLL